MSTNSSPSRTNSVAHILSKGRSHSRKAADTTSIVSNNSSEGKHGFRASIEGAIEKLKGEGDAEGEHGIAKITKKIGSKRRRKKIEKEEQERTSVEVARGRDVAERGTLENDTKDWNTSLDDRSSLLTYESDDEAYVPNIPPPLSTHPSHIGYLTTSSPLVQTSSVSAQDPSAFRLDGASKVSKATLETIKLASTESLPPVPSSVLKTPSDASSKRSTSPVGRLKDAFNPRRGPASNNSPERKFIPENPTKESDAAANRRGSVASRLGGLFPERQVPTVVTVQKAPGQSRNGRTVAQIDTNARPNTPPAGEVSAPLIVNTPPTPTDPGSPKFSNPRERGSSDPTTSNPNVITSPSGNMISHRRIRSGSATLGSLGPSKLSNITSAPLTPTPENGSITPGTNSQSGFFSTVFSAAQNAANTLSNSISNTSLAQGQTRSRSGTQDMKLADDVEVVPAGGEPAGEVAEEKELAVKTLGMGDLSLSHLGISEVPSTTNTPTGATFPETQERGRPEIANRDEPPPSRAVTAAPVMMTENLDTSSSITVDDIQPARPRSVYEHSVAGDQTPPNGSVFDGKTGITRSGSIRSTIGASSRRKRGSSAATGTTIGAAIASANASVAHPAAQGSTPKLTGFAVASKKRNRDFHQLFRSVPDDDYLIEDYSCALQREILAHGRLYVSEGHLCFSSNIFGWVTTLVMSFDEIVSVEKRSTALLFKNGLEISTLHAKNVFASFTSRDSTYDLIVGIWKLGHPSLRSSLNGVRIAETGGGDKTEKDDGNSQSGSGSEDGSEDGNVYDEDDSEGDEMSFTQAEGSIAGSDVADKIVTRKASAAVASNNGVGEKSKEISPASTTSDFPGPVTHVPTECSDQDTHYSKIIADEIIPAPLGKVYNLMFGPGSVKWLSGWLSGEQKCLDLQMEDKKGLSNENKSRTYSYIKPLNGSIGPKQTKCITTETLDTLDLEKAISVTMSTQTPDVPSGNVFSTKTKYCLSWSEGNGTRMQMNCAIEWTGKSWLKGPIEKGANDGQVQYAKDITAALNAAVSSKPRAGTSAGPSKGKKRSRKSGKLGSSHGRGVDGASDSRSVSKPESWGLLDPLRPVLGPVVDIFKPLLSGNMVYGLLVGLLVAAWFSFGNHGRSGRDMGYFGSPERIAAYEEIWKHEESALWDWLEERVGMDRVHNFGKANEAKSIEDRLREQKVGDREVEIAIKVTEEKLKALKGAFKKQAAPDIPVA